MRQFKFSHSELQNAECSNKHFILNEKGLRSKRYSRVKGLAQGKIFHSGVELLRKASERKEMTMEDLLNEELLQKVLSHMRVLVKDEKKKLVPEEGESKEAFNRKLDIDLGIPIVMLEAYYHHIFLAEKYETVESELWFEVPVKTPTGRKSPNKTFRGKLDGILRNVSGDGKLYLDETKTAASWSSRNERYLAVDDQSTAYCWAAKQLGYDVEGIVYTVCVKPSSKPNLTKEAKAWAKEQRDKGLDYEYNNLKHREGAEEYLERIREDYLQNPEKYFIRKIFERTDEDLQAFEKRLYYKCEDAIQVIRQPAFPQPNPMRCPMCSAFDLCANFTKEVEEKYYMPKKYDYEDLDEILDDIT